MIEKPYNKKEALDEASQMKKLVGDKASREDYAEAELILEGEKARRRAHEPGAYFELQRQDTVFYLPPMMDKRHEIVFETKDPKKFRIFNDACNNVLKKYEGFWQIGSGQRVGYSAWELHGLNRIPTKGDPDPYEIVKEVQEEMVNIEKYY
jgi:hypothetical protein